MKVKLKCNCKNEWSVEGYAENIIEKTDKQGRPEMTFKLTTIHTPKGSNVKHFTSIKVILKEKQVYAVKDWIKPMMLVIAEGHYHLGENGKAVMAGQRVYCAEPFMDECDFKTVAEREKDGEVNGNKL